MTVIFMELRKTAPRTPMELWSYSWNITFTWRSEYESAAYGLESRETATSPDELADIIRRNALDPRIIGYRYERQEVLDMSAAPAHCSRCEEQYAIVPPRRWWRPCSCGGHHVYQCTNCDHQQMYPELVITCI